MVTFADKRAAIGAAWMALAAVVMLGAGIVALATGIPLLVAGLFLITAVPCALVAVSLFLVARRGRGEEQPVSADAVQAASEEVDPVPASTE
jgi:heme A synthase